MPLRLLEQVLPWLVAVLSEEEAKEMLRNMRLAGSMHLCPLFSLHSVLSRLTESYPMV
jgi:zinc finger-like protein